MCFKLWRKTNECVGELIGEPHDGLKAMFTMMNNARLNVGIQGIAIAERSYQKAISFARERKQGFHLIKIKRKRLISLNILM